jgi:hypothetical protein
MVLFERQKHKESKNKKKVLEDDQRGEGFDLFKE